MSQEGSGDSSIGWLIALVLCIVVGVFFQVMGVDCLSSLFFLGAFVSFFYWGKSRRQPEGQPVAAEPPRLPTETVWFTVRVPRNQSWQPANASSLIRSLLEHFPPKNGRLDLYVETDGKRIVWGGGVTAPSVSFNQILSSIRSYYPHAEVVRGSDLDAMPEHGIEQSLYFLRNNDVDDFLPLQTSQEIRSPDPLSHLAQVMEDVRPGERLVYLVTVYGLVRYTKEQVDLALTQTMAQAGQHLPQYTFSHKSFSDAFADGIVRGWIETRRRVPKDYTPTEMRRFRAKLSQNLYIADIALCMVSEKQERQHLLTDAKVPIVTFAHPNYPMFSGEHAGRGQPHVLYGRLPQAVGPRTIFLLAPDEIAALWHLPHEDFRASKIDWLAGYQIQAPRELTEKPDGVKLGTNRRHGEEQPVRVSASDRATHMVAFGKTGTGKSTLLHHLIHQDIAAGNGVAVLDPHGKLIDDILAASIPKKRVQDVVLLECGRTDFPVPLNPFRIPEGVSYDTAFNYLYWVLRKVYEGIWLEGQTDRVMRNVLRTLLCDPDATPLDIQRILTSGKYRASLMEKLKEGRMRASVLFWQEYNEMSPSLQSQVKRPILNRTEAFLGGSAIERMTCHPHTLNFQEFAAQKKIVLINMSGEAIHSEVDSLGAMFLSGFYMAFHAMGYIPEGQSPRYYLYVDEVERYVTGPVQDMLSEARKLGLSLTLVNQYLDQLGAETLNSMLGNVGTILAFECGDRDARALDSQFEPEIDRQTLLNLGTYNVAVKTRSDGRTLPAFTVATRPPPRKRKDTQSDHIRQQSIAQNSFIPAQEVDDWLDKRYFSEEETSQEPDPMPSSGDGLGDYE